jgi:hypothetical protein
VSVQDWIVDNLPGLVCTGWLAIMFAWALWPEKKR